MTSAASRKEFHALPPAAQRLADMLAREPEPIAFILLHVTQKGNRVFRGAFATHASAAIARYSSGESLGERVHGRGCCVIEEVVLR